MRVELFARGGIGQAQSFRTRTDPLAGADFSGGVIIVLSQMFVEVALGMALGLPGFTRASQTSRTKRRDQQPRRRCTQRAFLKPRSTTPSSVSFHSRPASFRFDSRTARSVLR